jgi:lipopolysaccharide biosynthesis glycosyltransferase
MAPDRLLRGGATERGDAPGREPVSVLFCCNPGFYQHLAVALVSMLKNNAGIPFDVHLIVARPEGALEAKLRQSFRSYGNLRLTIHGFPRERYAHFFVDNHLSPEAYLRIFAADVLPSHMTRVLYLDCDLVVLGNLWPLWTIDIEAVTLAGVPDPFGDFRRAALGIDDGEPYVNSGVLLMNLTRWRAEDVTERLVHFIESKRSELIFHDQDALNAVLRGQILALEPRWNVQAQMFRPKRHRFADPGGAIRQACRNPVILHYTSAEKPWNFRAIAARKHHYFRYLAKTAWRGTWPRGMKWYHYPEFWLDRALDRIGLDYTWVVRLARKVRSWLDRSDTRASRVAYVNKVAKQ